MWGTKANWDNITRTQKYHLYPTKSQIEQLGIWFVTCTWLYNYALNQRKRINKKQGWSLTYIAQQNQLPAPKEQHATLIR